MKKDNIYIGMRYVPRFMGIFNPHSEYEPLSLVKQEENSSVIYISIIPVPSGTSLTDTTYWQSYTTSADISGLEAELAALTTKVNANEGAITGLTTKVNANEGAITGLATTVQENTASIQTVTTKTNNNTNRIIGLESSIANIRPIKPIRWFIEDGTAPQQIGYIPNPTNFSSSIIGEDAYSAYPSLFDEFPYITQTTWVDKNNSNSIILDNMSRLVSKTNPDIQIHLDNQKPEGGYFIFHLNKTTTNTAGPDSRDLRIPQVPNLTYPLQRPLIVTYQNTPLYNGFPSMKNSHGTRDVKIKFLESWLRQYTSAAVLNTIQLRLHDPEQQVALQLTDSEFTVQVNATSGFSNAAIGFKVGVKNNWIGLPIIPWGS